MDCICDVKEKRLQDDPKLLSKAMGRMGLTCTEIGKTVGVASFRGRTGVNGEVQEFNFGHIKYKVFRVNTAPSVGGIGLTTRIMNKSRGLLQERLTWEYAIACSARARI